MVSWYTIFLSNLIAIGGSSLILAPAIAGYVLHWNIGITQIWGISSYGIFVFCFFLVQMLFSELNRSRILSWISHRRQGWDDVRVAVIIAGYREDPYMFKKCLESVRDSDYTNVARLICVIDGNENEDVKMSEVYRSVYNENIKNVDFLLAEDANRHIDTDFSRDICVLQPHCGKRESLYTGFKLAMMDPSVHAVVLIDSDTILEKDAILEVVYPLACESAIQAVAGECKIWNTDTLLSMLVSWRYFSAFCVERSAQSFFKTVQCVGGPLGAYKIDIIKEIMDPWINQRFLNQKCTYGDDRRLTNEILMRGKKVVFTPFAVGWSDSPTNLLRYIVQQTRWSKSWCREIWYTLFAAWKHGFAGVWLAFECLYQIMYFFLVMYLFSRLAIVADPRAQTATVLVSTAVAMLKCLYFAFRSRDVKAFYFVLYTFVYFFAMIPSRLTAMLTLWDISWGTRGSSEQSTIFSKTALWMKQFLIAYMWWGCVIAAGIYSIIHNWYFDWSSLNYRFAFVGILSYICFVCIILIVYFIGKMTRWNYSRLQNDIIKNRVQISNV